MHVSFPFNLLLQSMRTRYLSLEESTRTRKAEMSNSTIPKDATSTAMESCYPKESATNGTVPPRSFKDA